MTVNMLNWLKLLLFWISILHLVPFSTQECLRYKENYVKCSNISLDQYLHEMEFINQTCSSDTRLEFEIVDSNFTVLNWFVNPFQSCSLRTLSLMNSGIEMIDDKVLTMEFLEVLKLSGNKIKNFNFIKYLPNNLKQLYLDGNDARSLDLASLNRFSYLTYVDLSNCKLFDISSLPGGRSYNLSNNNLNIFKNGSNCRYTNVDLSFNNLENVHLQCSFDTLNISNCNITYLSAEFLRNIEARVIFINYNRINHIQPYTLQTKLIDNFDFSYSSLRIIEPNAFNQMRTLGFNISFNQLSNLAPFTFNNSQIQILDISNNNLTRLESKTFFGINNLNKLYLRENRISSIHDSTFQDIKTLKVLDLSHNPFKKIGTIFFDLIYLSKLYLSNIDIVSLAVTDLITLKYLEKLYLDSNLITELSNNTFTQNTRLTELSLNDNKLTYLPPGLFANLTDLQILRLENNNLSYEAGSSPFPSRLQAISLSFNTFIPPNIFQNLDYLNSLNISDSYNLSLKQSNFLGLSTLRKINLFNVTINNVEPGSFIGFKNSIKINCDVFFKNITIIKANQFFGLFQLNILNLSNSNIKHIEMSGFNGLWYLKELLLNNNKLETLLAYTFSNSRYLTHIDLSNNQIQQISLGTFQFIPSLLKLNLQSNRLQKLQIGTFSNLKNLEELDVSYNLISNLDEKIFFSLKSLVTLKLNNNNLIRINFYLLTDPLRSLKSIDINLNKWKCNYLDLMLSHFKNRSIDYTPNENVFFSNNINGIACIDDCNYLYCDDNK